MEEDRKRKLTIKELVHQQEELQQKRVALQKASTIVECLQAVKSYDLVDLGQGHAKGGTREHHHNRMQVMDRVRGKAAPLPPELLNDWTWFCKHWDATRLALLWPDAKKAAWAKQFKDIMIKLTEDIRAGPQALVAWMQQERAQYLRAHANAALRC